MISGFFLIVEDQVRVGDSAVVNGQGGLVEQVNLRTIVLRRIRRRSHLSNGEVKTLASMSKDFAYYVVTVALTADADVDGAVDAMQKAAAGMMNDAQVPSAYPGPRWTSTASMHSEQGQLVLKARIKTVPQKQWLVGRELRKRILQAFAQRGATDGHAGTGAAASADGRT